MSRHVVILHSALAPNAVGEVLRRSIDEEHWTLFSLSGYRGERPILGEVGKNTFRLQKRRYSRNDFTGHFHARFEPESGEQESRATSMLPAGRNTSCGSGLPVPC